MKILAAVAAGPWLQSCDFLVMWHKDGKVNFHLSSVSGADIHAEADNSPNWAQT